MKNSTITSPGDVARWLPVEAAQDDRSVSKWLAELLQAMRREEDFYEVAMKRHMAMKPHKIEWPDGRRPTREELHDAGAVGNALQHALLYTLRHV